MYIIYVLYIKIYTYVCICIGSDFLQINPPIPSIDTYVKWAR